MDQSELLRTVVAKMKELGLRYLVTGSMATIYFGEPRFTNDIDVVVSLESKDVADFCRAFGACGFYLNEESVQLAVAECSQFNMIHSVSGLKVDVMIPADTEFNRSRFARATRVQPAGDYFASFASIEDVLIKKMEYYREGGSEKHLRDITGVLKISGARVDLAYIADWASRLGLKSIWEAVLSRVGE